MNPPEPRSYPEGEALPECDTCHERSYYPREGKCLNPDCPSHRACEWCGERKVVVIILRATEDRLCLECARPVIRAMLEAVP